MKKEIEQQLNNLLGLHMWTARRAGDMLSFHFGGPHETLDHKGNKVLVGEYALHVQCAWRIVNESVIVVASNDRFYPKGTSKELIENFDWDHPGVNRCDERMTTFFENQNDDALIVESFDTDEVGSFRLFFKELYRLEIFPDNSFDAEYWRIFRPYLEDDIDERHFVVTAEGIENSD